MTVFVPIFIVFVTTLIILFVPIGQWKRLEVHFGLNADLETPVKIRWFSSVYLEDAQLNGLVSVFVYKDWLIFKHISPLMKPLGFNRETIIKTDKKKVGFDVFEVSGNGKKMEIGLRKGLLEIT